MSETMTLTPAAEPMNLLADWISREHLAEELMITPDTLSRWEARREGPPCVRIGRKVFYCAFRDHPITGSDNIRSVIPI